MKNETSVFDRCRLSIYDWTTEIQPFLYFTFHRSIDHPSPVTVAECFWLWLVVVVTSHGGIQIFRIRCRGFSQPRPPGSPTHSFVSFHSLFHSFLPKAKLAHSSLDE